MERGPISPNTHGVVEPVVAVLFIVAPWLFGFSDITEAAVISVIVGATMLLTGMLTQWRYSVLKLIPLRTHFMADMALGALLILSPFIFGFSDEGGATRFMIIAGVLELLTALSTRWDPREADAPQARGRTSRSTRARASS
jgi:SPW repeat